MADAYGAVVLSMSEGCKVDEELLLKKLNELEWSSNGGKWTIEDKSFWYGSDVQYPTVRFRVPVTLEYYDADNNIQSVPIAEATQEQWDTEYDTIYDDMPLAQISEHFNECIRSGSIEIAATCNEKARYVQYESLTIHADMNVSYILHIVGTSPDYNTLHQMEEYSLGD